MRQRLNEPVSRWLPLPPVQQFRMQPSRRRPAASLLYKLGAVLVAAAITMAVRRGWLPSSAMDAPASTGSRAPVATRSDGPLSRSPSVKDLFDARRSGTWVETTGRVEKLLPDDPDTSDNSDKHQKFLLLVPGDITVLVAHNISTAARVPVKPGDRLALRGRYEYSDKGGTIHFTHQSKYGSRNREAGWIDFAGKRYE